MQGTLFGNKLRHQGVELLYAYKNCLQWKWRIVPVLAQGKREIVYTYVRTVGQEYSHIIREPLGFGDTCRHTDIGCKLPALTR